jgi:hypothetical protein
MEINVKITKENKDGSADAIVRFDKQGLETLIQWGLTSMLKRGIDEYATAEQIASRASVTNTEGRKPTIKPTKKKKEKEKEIDIDGRC